MSVTTTIIFHLNRKFIYKHLQNEFHTVDSSANDDGIR